MVYHLTKNCRNSGIDSDFGQCLAYLSESDTQPSYFVVPASDLEKNE